MKLLLWPTKGSLQTKVMVHLSLGSSLMRSTAESLRQRAVLDEEIRQAKQREQAQLMGSHLNPLLASHASPIASQIYV